MISKGTRRGVEQTYLGFFSKNLLFWTRIILVKHLFGVMIKHTQNSVKSFKKLIDINKKF